MVIFNVSILAIMLLLSFGWELQVKKEKVALIANGFFSLCLWYMIFLFAYSLLQVTTASGFEDMINSKLESLVYIVTIFGIVNASIKKRN